MTAAPARPFATYADIEALPPHLVGEIVAGVLHTQARPTPRHLVAATALAHELIGPFQKGRGGPGGWIFMGEPELHLGADVVVPDLAGWRRTRMRHIPEQHRITLPPDWVCEVISPSTESFDKGPKRVVYAAAGIPHLWHVDPRVKLVEGFANTNALWTLIGYAIGDDAIDLPPFAEAPFPVAALWPDDLDPATDPA